jgi:hypothetical protein
LRGFAMLRGFVMIESLEFSFYLEPPIVTP